ncbi:LysR family transcriptional regulator [Pontivivens insulae]|uniref:HTH-type transcriptional regulator HdfR n=1 Tax=Pontivivens insulae TaxID=1639689 RepID=A0A2R8ADW5_9RHOB|nr:LysR family transcriptional regulator [Pontivivens insulae]RED14364.1 LysR family transcriptional regulator [Pontivivens insulae]SPF30441.1 HTH-type transcriptional regulator HdfR [Pontivivens insulae]
MQQLDWSDLKFLLAVRRARSLAGAAVMLRVDATTVSRRLRRLERQLAAPLVERTRDGNLHLTSLGEDAADRAEAFEQQIDRLSTLGQGPQTGVSGVVRLTAAPMLINRVLIPQAGQLIARHPSLELQLEPDIRNLSLIRREADIAIRLGRPQDGGLKVQARKLGAFEHAVYCAREGSADAWIGYRDGMRELPQSDWMERHVRQSGQAFCPMRVGEIEGAVEAIAAGLGRSLLPCLIGDADPRLMRVQGAWAAQEVLREVWMLVHRDIAQLARTTAVRDWIQAVLDLRQRPDAEKSMPRQE